MTALNSPHDRFFKAVFGRTEVAAEFLERYLPAAAGQALDWKTLRTAKDSFLDPELALHPADLLYTVDLRSGGAGYVHVLFEHKSYVESRIGLDLLRYRVRIWEQWLNAGNSGRLPVVVPVVVYHGAASWCVSRQFADEVEDAPALRAYVPACVYHLIDLSGYRDDELQGAVMLHTALLTLKYIFRNELSERLPEILGLLRDLAQNSMGLDYVRTLLRYLAQAASIDRLSGDELRQVVTETLSGGGELMLTIAEQWEQQAMERGIAKGIQRGIEKGIEQGEARLLKQLLTWRFGALPPWVESQLAGAEPERLEAWAKRVLDAPTLDAVFVEGYGDSILNCKLEPITRRRTHPSATFATTTRGVIDHPPAGTTGWGGLKQPQCSAWLARPTLTCRSPIHRATWTERDVEILPATSTASNNPPPVGQKHSEIHILSPDYDSSLFC